MKMLTEEELRKLLAEAWERGAERVVDNVGVVELHYTDHDREIHKKDDLELIMRKA